MRRQLEVQAGQLKRQRDVLEAPPPPRRREKEPEAPAGPPARVDRRGRVEDRACRHCGPTGHLANQCPQNPTAPETANPRQEGSRASRRAAAAKARATPGAPQDRWLWLRMRGAE